MQEKGKGGERERNTVSVSSVTDHANFAIGCFSYKGLLILSRATKLKFWITLFRKLKIECADKKKGCIQLQERKHAKTKSISLKKGGEKRRNHNIGLAYQEQFPECFPTEESWFANSCSIKEKRY